MGNIVAIICEYNPFHNGHKYQIDKIRKAFPNSAIVAIMSGNVTQRAELAMVDKYTRACGAVMMGVNAVFEIPYPFSCSNAELYAMAGVQIAHKIGADYLCFGSESNNLEYLCDIADTIDSEAFEEELREIIKDKSKSYISAKETALRRFGKRLPNTPNDMLAVEYLRAIKAFKASIIPYPIKREGPDYNDLTIGEIMSAAAIRDNFYKNKSLLSIPTYAKAIFNEEIANGHYLDKNKAEDFLFRFVLMSSVESIEQVFDAPSGCGCFISEIAKKSDNAEAFFKGLTSKTYTYARLRRLVMYLVTGVTELNRNAIFTTLLACDKLGRDLIKNRRKELKITILTKQADVKKLNDVELKLFKLSKKSDELYLSLLKEPIKANEAYKKSPIIL